MLHTGRGTAPPSYFEQHPVDEIQLPQLNPDDDLDDVPDVAKRYLKSGTANLHARVTGNDLYEPAIQAYLAQITFADTMLGKILDALDQSGAAEKHGHRPVVRSRLHLGEKQKWHKGQTGKKGPASR